MAARTVPTTPSTIQCPGEVCTCGGTEMVTIRLGRSKDPRTGARRDTLVYGPCSPLVEQGWDPNQPSQVLWV